MTHIQNEAGLCPIGMPCRYPDKKTGHTIWRAMCCSGLILEILENVIRNMDIEYDLYIVEDGSFGGFQNGSWTGIMNDVYTGKADVGIQAMSQLPERLPYVDYTEPILGSWFGIVRRRDAPHIEVINWIFMSKLRLDLILTVWGVFFVNFLFTIACENTLLKLLALQRYPTRELFSYLSGLLFQRDLGAKNPQFWSSRLPCIFYAIAMTIIMTSYTANLTAANLVYEDNDDFNGLHDPMVLLFIINY